MTEGSTPNSPIWSSAPAMWNPERPLDFDLLRRHIGEGIVNETKHPVLPLSIFNYSPRCQYDKLWDEVTLQCRGLVLRDETVVARPFRKFFNDSEHPEGEIPWHLPSEVTEKMDGSLLIVFWFGDQWHYTTRGSFTSEQSQVGRQIFQRRYSEADLDPQRTYLFEVIYPTNRIVVNYGDIRDTVLLAMLETTTGTEVPLSESPASFTVVRRLGADVDHADLRSLIRDDEEGYVIRFANGFRVKVKGRRYMELHRLITGVSSRTIWEHLSQQQSLDEMLAIIPDEFGDWVRAEREQLLAQYAQSANRVVEAIAAVGSLPDRKSQALRILTDFSDVAAAAFLALDGKNPSPPLWKSLYPKPRRPKIADRIEG